MKQKVDIMKWVIIILLAIAAIWDIFTTGYGTVQILGAAPLPLSMAILFTLLIFAFNFNTKRLMQWRNAFVSIVAKFIWFVALCYDFYTSWVGNADLLIGRAEGGFAQYFVLFGLTLMVTVSPMLLLAIWELPSIKRDQAESASETQQGTV